MADDVPRAGRLPQRLLRVAAPAAVRAGARPTQALQRSGSGRSTTPRRGTYGAPRIHAELRAAGRARRAQARRPADARRPGLPGCQPTQGPWSRPVRDPTARPAPDLVRPRSSRRRRRDRLWVADITYVPTLGRLPLPGRRARRLRAGGSSAGRWPTHLRTRARARGARHGARAAPARRTSSITPTRAASTPRLAFGAALPRGRRAAVDGHRSATAYDNAMCESFFGGRLAPIDNDPGEDLRHHESRRRDGRGRRRRRRARLHLRREHAALRDAGAGGARSCARCRRSSRRSASSGTIRPATSRRWWRRAGCARCSSTATRSPRTSRATRVPVIKTIKLPPAEAMAGLLEGRTDDFAAGGALRRARRRDPARQRRALERGRGASADRVAPGPRACAPAAAGCILSGGLTPDNVAARGRDGGPVRGGRRTRAWRPRPAARIPTRCGASSARPSGRCSCEPAARRPGPLRPLRRSLRPRDADGAADRAREGLRGGAARPEVPAPARRAARRLRRPAHAALLRRAPDRALRRRARSGSSARTSVTPARTRSTTCSARPCWPRGWASSA